MRVHRPRAISIALIALSAILSGCDNSFAHYIAPAGDFNIAVLPANLSLQAGAAAAPFTATITPTGGFAAAVSITAVASSPTILCAEPACTVVIPAGSTTGVLHFSPSPTAQPGTYNLTFTATSGAATHIATATITVTSVAPAPDFSFSVSPQSVSTVAGAAAPPVSFSILPSNGFSAAVTIATSLPTGVACSLSPCSLTTSAQQLPNAMQFTPASTLAPGAYTLNFIATSGTLTHMATVTLVVIAPQPTPDFNFAVSPSTTSITAGTDTPGYAFTLTPLGGFSSAVTITAAPPSGFTCTSNPCSLTTSSTSAASLTFNTSATLAPGTYSIVFTAVSGALSHTATATVVVTAPAPPVVLACGGTALTPTTPTPGPTSFVYTGEVPPAAIYDSLHNVIFVSNHQLAEIDVISPNTLAILARIPVSQPRGLDLTADNSTLIVGTDTHFFYRIDTSSLCVIDRNYLTGIPFNLSPMFVVALADSSVLIELQDIATTASGVAVWTPTAGAKQLYPGTYLNLDVGRMVRSGDHQHAFLSESSNGGYIARYDVSTQQFTVQAPRAGTFANVQAANFDGSRLYFTADCCGLTVADASLTPLASYNTYFGSGFTLSPDGSRLYLSEGYSQYITVLDSSTLLPLGYLPAQLSGAGGPSGGYLGANTALQFDGAGRILTATTYGLKLVALDASLLSTSAAATVYPGGITVDNIDQGSAATLSFNAPTATTLKSLTFAEGTTVLPASASIVTTTYGSPQISLTAPGFSSGCADLTATFNLGTGSYIPHAFCYSPVVSALNGDAGPSSGGAVISIIGKGFGAHPTVRIGGFAATVTTSPAFYATTAYEPETLTVTVPPGTPGSADITISNGIGRSTTLAKAFTYFTRQDAALPSAAAPFQILYDSFHNRLLWTDSARNLLVVSSPSTGQTMQEIPVGNTPQGLSLSPDGTRLAIATAGDRSITLYDATLFTKIQSVVAPTSSGTAYVPLFVAIIKSGNVLVTVAPSFGLQGGYGSAAVYTYDLPSNTLLPLSTPFNLVCSNIAGIASSADGSIVRVGTTLYTTTTGTLTPLSSNYNSCSQFAISADGAINADPTSISDSSGIRQNFYSPPSEIAAKLNGIPNYSDSSFADTLALNATGSLAYMQFATTYSGIHSTNHLRIFDTAHGSLVRSIALPGGFTLPSIGQPLALDPAGQQIWLFTPSGLSTLQFLADPLTVGEVKISGTTLTLLGSGFTPSLIVTVDGQQLSSTTNGTTTATATLPTLAPGTHSVAVSIPGQTTYTLPSAIKIP
jgi:hypothetical protein